MFWCPPTEGNMLQLLDAAHQLLANCVRLQFLAGQVAHDGYLELFHWNQLPDAPKDSTDESSDNKTKTVSQRMSWSSAEPQSDDDYDSSSLWARPFSWKKSCDPLLIKNVLKLL